MSGKRSGMTKSYMRNVNGFNNISISIHPPIHNPGYLISDVSDDDIWTFFLMLFGSLFGLYGANTWCGSSDNNEIYRSYRHLAQLFLELLLLTNLMLTPSENSANSPFFRYCCCCSYKRQQQTRKMSSFRIQLFDCFVRREEWCIHTTHLHTNTVICVLIFCTNA